MGNKDNKRKPWYSRNYFFCGTIFIILLTLICYFVFEKAINELAEKLNFNSSTYYGSTDHPWYLIIFLSSFKHSNVMHVIGNMLCLLGIGLFFEDKIGSLKFTAMYFLFVVIGNATSGGFTYVFTGASAGTYCLFGLFCVIVIFGFKKYMLNGKDSTLNLVCLGLNLFFYVLVTGGAALAAASHFFPFIIGVAIGLIYVMLNGIKSSTNSVYPNDKEKK